LRKRLRRWWLEVQHVIGWVGFELAQWARYSPHNSRACAIHGMACIRAVGARGHICTDCHKDI
jgi:hypothetical protein